MEINIKEITKKTSLISFVIIVILTFIAVIYFGFKLLLLIFAALLISLLFEGISDFISKYTKWNKKITLPISIVGVIGIMVFLFNIIGSAIILQIEQLVDKIPLVTTKISTFIAKYDWVDDIIPELNTIQNNTTYILKYTQKLFSSTFGMMGDGYAIIFFALFILLSPKTYKEGIVKLVPNSAKEKTSQILNDLSTNLQTWLKAQFISMLFIFSLTAIGLFFLGIDLWLILALIAGLLSFIPNLGPTLALIPAALVGITINPMTALYIIAIFLIVQALESAILAPYIQKNMLSLAPVLVLFAQLFLGGFAGIMGILLATPILIVIVHLIDEIYIKGMLKKNKEESESTS